MELIIREREKGEREVEGAIPSKCSVKGYRVKLILRGEKVVEGKCECGSFPCPHSSKLYLVYMRAKSLGNPHNSS